MKPETKPENSTNGAIATLRCTDSIGSIVRNIIGALRESGKTEVIGQVIDLQMIVSELIEKNRQLAKDNHALEEQLSLKAKMVFRKPIYWQEGDRTPFCPSCWESEGKAVHLVDGKQNGYGERVRTCVGCGREY